jgi:glycosyltransferase involved in cell wall biosynthesis
MRIAINTRGLLQSEIAADSLFIYESFKIIAIQNPAHDFIFFTDNILDTVISSLKNIELIVIDTKTKNPLLWQIWYNHQLPSLIKKYKADILVNANGICSMRVKAPQCLIIQNHPGVYKKKLRSSLDKAKIIIAASQYIKDGLFKNYKMGGKKIDVVHTAPNELFKPIDWKEKETVKEKYAEGKEFFLFAGTVGAENNLINLLKAFSFFKKRQKSNMQLLIAAIASPQLENFTESLKTYKYRNEVKLLQNLPASELAKITASAYAFICPSLSEKFIPSLLEAMKCDVPVIVSDIPAFHEICADAALYANPNSFGDFADKIMLIFKDEKKRNEMIEKGKQQAQLYSWNKTASLLWEAIFKMA